jgi:hypothetical protein
VSENQEAHSKIGASSMDRWSACPGSVRLCEGLPEQKSSYAEEGTFAHEVAACVLNSGFTWQEARKIYKGKLDLELEDAVQTYTGLIFGDLQGAKDAQLFVEERFHLHQAHPSAFGTSDAIIYYPSKKLLRVYDYKHGAGVAVEVDNNSQLMYYGLGALLKLQKPCTDVELIIVQPRCPHPKGPVRRWKIPSIDLIDFTADLIDYIKKTEDPFAPLVPGEHCRWCRAAGVCPALQNTALEVAKTEFSQTQPYDPARLAEVLKLLPTIEEWCANVRKFAYAEAEHGRTPPGYKLVDKEARRKWLDNIDPKALAAEFNLTLEDVTETSPKNLTEIEKLVGKKEFAAKGTKFFAKKSSGTTLVEDTDSRPAINRDPKSEFQVIDTNPVTETVEDLFS